MRIAVSATSPRRICAQGRDRETHQRDEERDGVQGEEGEGEGGRGRRRGGIRLIRSEISADIPEARGRPDPFV